MEIPDLGGGGGYHILCVLADCQQCWNGTTYILTINLIKILSHYMLQVYALRYDVQVYPVHVCTSLLRMLH